MSKIKKVTYVKIRNKASLRAIARRYANGDLMSAIAADYDIDPGTVRNIARAAGVEIRPRGRPEVSR